MTNVELSKCNLSITFSYHHEGPGFLWVTSRNINIDNQKVRNSPLAADLGKVQLQGVVQHHTESLDHVIVSSLSPRQDSAAEIMRLELGETFEIKRLLKIISFFLQGLCSEHGGKQDNVSTFSNMYCLMCLDLSILFCSLLIVFVVKGFSTYLSSFLSKILLHKKRKRVVIFIF